MQNPPHMRPNKVLDFQDPNLVRMLENITPKVELSQVEPGRSFQFAGDRCCVRQVIAVDGEFVLVRTCGNTDEALHYAVHYSWLRPNKSPIWDDYNQLRKFL